ncbi:hypothetical protein HG66A1_62890 [Gimesia chilikensis]|uniref:Uncharacterized protein n=1 Tax=Gimesia chilikensis TaxID=2605989 RepID=A0A517PYK2_9PLAN|nr:hypothetical protein HG66A1_62890 [Gimesia chilikensis]
MTGYSGNSDPYTVSPQTSFSFSFFTSIAVFPRLQEQSDHSKDAHSIMPGGEDDVKKMCLTSKNRDVHPTDSDTMKLVRNTLQHLREQ